MTANNAIIEAAARGLCRVINHPEDRWHMVAEPAERILAAVTPLIRAAALEEAAQIVKQWSGKRDILHLIRALKEQP
jgi:hypothetical protein